MELERETRGKGLGRKVKLRGGENEGSVLGTSKGK